MPQVQVALRELAKGKQVRKDDVIAYIDVMKRDSNLKPDVEWYLYKQIFPPVERLCANISGTDTAVTMQRFILSKVRLMTLVRFKDSTRLTLRCRSCKATFGFEGLLNSPENCSPSGIICRCGTTLPILSIMTQLEHQIRQETCKYYEGWLVCDDQACGNRTRQMSVYGHRCLGPKGLAQGCMGKMRYEYTEKMMYNQLLYFSSLFDVDKAKATARGHGERTRLRIGRA
ncbi:hypothetical protein EYC84_011890 [Monilinia fructicola]|uniref:DNA-directed DNA polymerase n=1 Tax=Monilinia fructicola TaxID=38448 RepID=A0A5M9J9D6_MONFR|nr:hypothetical protein EYC84_011890 [Monilinia fructicola]